MTLNDDMHDTLDGLGRIAEEQEQAKIDRELSITRQIAEHLGPDSETDSQSYMVRLASMSVGRRLFPEREASEQPRRRSRSRDVSMEVSTNDQPPPPPPGSAPIICGGKAPKMIPVISKIDEPRRRGRPPKRRDDMEVEIKPPPPGPPPPPAGMNAPPSKKGVKKDKVKPTVKKTITVRSKSEPRQISSKLTPQAPEAAPDKVNPRIPPTPPPPPKRSASTTSEKAAKKQAPAESSVKVQTPPPKRSAATPQDKPTKKQDVKESPKLPVIVATPTRTHSAPARSRARTPDVEELFDDEPKTPAAPKKKAKDKSSLTRSRSRDVSSAAAKTHATERKYAPQSTLKDNVVIETLKEVINSIEKSDREKVLAIAVEIDDTTKETRKGMVKTLRDIYKRNCKFFNHIQKDLFI